MNPPSELRVVINGQVVTASELVQSIRDMPKSDRKLLMDDLKMLDILEADIMPQLPRF